MNTSTMSQEDALPNPEILGLEDQICTFFEHFGFRRNLGRIWAVLFLFAEPMDQAELGRRLGLSAGLISAALRELEQIGAVRSAQKNNPRRILYQAEPNLLRTVSTILARRDLEAVRALHERVSLSRKRLAQAPDLPAGLDDRLALVEDLAELYELLARLVIRLGRDPSRGLGRLLRLLRASRTWLPLS